MSNSLPVDDSNIQWEPMAPEENRLVFLPSVQSGIKSLMERPRASLSEIGEKLFGSTLVDNDLTVPQDRINQDFKDLHPVERYQLWPEKMVKSAVTLPGDVMSGAEPIIDPLTGHTSENVIQRAQDLAGMAGGAAIAERPGTATLGSGMIRQRLKEIQDAYPDVKLDVSGGESDKPLILSRIEVPKANRNQGIGTEIMEQLGKAADDEGVSIALSPSKDFGGNVNKLKEFYSRFGFKPNKGSNKDFSVSESYIRNPLEQDHVRLYRGEYSGNKGGNFWTSDPEFARQFTQGGLQSEVLQRVVNDNHIYKPKYKPYAGDMDAVDKAVAEARSKGFKAVELSEGQGQPNSVYVFNKGALKLASDTAEQAPLAAMAKQSHKIDWNLVKSAETSLKGDAARAIDTWVGGDVNFKENGGETGVWSPNRLKDALKNPELKSQLDTAMQPVLDHLKSQYGDTIPLYRYHGDLPDNASPRELLSFTSDPKYAEQHGQVPREQKLFSNEEIAAKEKELNDKGSTKLGQYEFTKNEYGTIDIDDPSVGGFLTDTESIKDFVDSMNEELSKINNIRNHRMKNIVKKNIPIDDIVFATDRFGQKEFIVKNSNNKLFSDTSNNAPIAALANQTKAPTFYSAVEHAVKNAKQDKATGEQWVNYLRNQPGVKQEELGWLGLDSIPEALQGTVTKKQVEDYLASNKVDLKEVQNKNPNVPPIVNDIVMTMGNKLDNIKTIEDLNAAKQFNLHFRESTKDIPDKELLGLVEQARAHNEEFKDVNPTKFHDYQLPGGENYKEMLLTLPNKPTAKISFEDWFNQTHVGDLDKLSPSMRRFAEREYEKYGQNVVNPDVYKSSHWDEANVLAHIRMNDRTINGQKTLHLEEIQSDWHQAGRKRGYIGDPDPVLSDRKLSQETDSVPNAPFRKSWDELALKRMIRHAAENGYDQISWTPGEAQAARYDLSKQIERIHFIKTDSGDYLIAPEAKGGSEVPVNNGQAIPKDKIADYVGKEVAEKIIEKGDNPPVRPTELPEGYELIKNSDKWGVMPSTQGHARSMVGLHSSKDEAIRQAINHIHSELTQKNNVLENVDLRIGGEGMKAFYDKMLVDKMNNIAKKFGGKVEQADLGEKAAKGPLEIRKSHTTANGEDIYSVYANDGKLLETDFKSERAAEDAVIRLKYKEDKSVPVHVIKLPQKLKDTALNRGFPLFASGLPFTFTPVQGNPFKLDDE